MNKMTYRHRRMLFSLKPTTPSVSPVLVVDALGFANQIHSASAEELVKLGQRLDRQYHSFRAKIPFAWVFITARKVFGSKEFSTFQLNDMFAMFSQKYCDDILLRYLIASSLLYQILLLEGFLPRGGLGFGFVLQRNQWLIGNGFIDAYRTAEKREQSSRYVCAIQISPTFMSRMPPSEKAYRLLCYFENQFFLNPRALHDPDMGLFDNDRILQLLRTAGGNQNALESTEKFLYGLEDFDAARKPGSQSWKYPNTELSKLGQPKSPDPPA